MKKKYKMEIIDICGIITDIKYNDDQSRLIKIKGIQVEKTVTVLCTFFCPVRKSDSIYASCQKVEGKKEMYVICKPPMVMISKDKKEIISNIMKILKIKYYDAERFYQDISNIVPTEYSVYDYITSLAERWCNYKDQKILEMFGDNDKDYNIKNLLTGFHKTYNLRKLFTGFK